MCTVGVWMVNIEELVVFSHMTFHLDHFSYSLEASVQSVKMTMGDCEERAEDVVTLDAQARQEEQLIQQAKIASLSQQHVCATYT